MKSTNILGALCLTAGLATAWEASADPVEDPIALNVNAVGTLYNAHFLYMGFSSGVFSYSSYSLGTIAPGPQHFDFDLARPNITDGTYYFALAANYDVESTSDTFRGGPVFLSRDSFISYFVTLGVSAGSGLLTDPFPLGDEDLFGAALETPDLPSIESQLDTLTSYALSSSLPPGHVSFSNPAGTLINFSDGTDGGGWNFGPAPSEVPEAGTSAALVGIAGLLGFTWLRRRAAK